MGILRMLTHRGIEYCVKPDHHDYPLYLAINDIEHTKTKVRSHKTNGICERFHKTILNVSSMIQEITILSAIER